MARERLRSLGRILRLQPYEAAIGVGSLSGVVELATGRGSSALSAVIPHWALHVLGGMAVLGGLWTLVGLAMQGFVVDDVRRVMARRMEQTGQIMISGVLLVIGIGAATYGVTSVVPGTMELAISVAAAVRAAVIAESFRAARRLP